jgi:site-specific DNA-methyltransferase (adenine-specific)
VLKLNKIYQGDSLKVLKTFPKESVGCIVTDPPYGFSFMGKNWDKVVIPVPYWRECLRVLKPGAFAFVMSAPRQDVLGRAIGNLSEAGFNMGFTSVYWAYASGFPKASNIGKMVDKRLGKKRKVVGRYIAPDGKTRSGGTNFSAGNKPKNPKNYDDRFLIKKPATTQAKALDGSYAGFQPKPAVEVILVCMKPLSEKTYTDQALKNRKGVSWLDDGRIPYESKSDVPPQIARNKRNIKSREMYGGTSYYKSKTSAVIGGTTLGRFSANLLVSDDCLNDGREGYDDSGSFSRYFSLDKWWKKKFKQFPSGVRKTFPFLIVPKASKKEKNRGLEGFKDGGKSRNSHPTVKPIKLMSYLITLGSRKGDIILDPFIGSGTTAIAAKMLGRKYVGIEKNPEYIKIARKRIKNVPLRLI